MAGTIKQATLHDTGVETKELFQLVIDEPAGDTGHEEWPKAQFAAEADRFELWAVNLGLFVSGHGSLDYRVRQAENVKSMLQKFMTALNDSLAEGQSPFGLYSLL
jgi:hypothetical protein